MHVLSELIFLASQINVCSKISWSEGDSIADNF